MRSPKPAAKKPADPIKPKRGRGRPEHVVTSETTATVMRLLAIGHNNDEVSAAIGITHETLHKHYGPILATAKMKVRAALVNAMFKAAYSGNVSALKKAIEMTGEDQPYQIPTAPVVKEAVEPKAKPLGKKEELALAAANPDTSSRMGALMAARQNEITH